MRNLRIVFMVVLSVLWAGAVWADEGDRGDRSVRWGWKDNGDRHDNDHSDDKDDKDDFAPVPQTGQVISYDANTPKRDDGALQKGVELPAPRFTDKGNGTIKDNLTGLIWLKNANCPNLSRDWQTALNDVASLNASGKMNGNDCGDTSGKRGTHRIDWRLPNIRELFSLVDAERFNPALPADHPFVNFFGTNYWSSTTIVDIASNAWVVSFDDGFVDRVNKDFRSLFVTAVRGGLARANRRDKDDFAPVPQTGQVISYDANTPKRDDGALQKGVELPTPRFSDKRDGTIRDNLTGLIWLKNANCPNLSRAWQTALNDVVSLNTSGKMNGNDCGDTSGKRGTHRTDWRLPNIRELFSLVDAAFFNPPISNAAGTGNASDSDPFSNFATPSTYWSSTTIADNTFDAFFLFFVNGFIERANKDGGRLHVIAVRGGS